MKFIFIYITASSQKEARKIARHLLEKRFIACANIFEGIESMFWWEGKIKSKKECVIIAKTVDQNYEKIKKEIENIHSFSIPCIVKISASANKKYGEWIENETR